MVVDAYSWELTSCKTYSNGFKVYFDAYFISPAPLLELSLPPSRSIGSSYFVFVFNGLAPLIFPLSSFSYKVFGFGMRTKGSY